MRKHELFALRWILTSFGLWIAVRLFGEMNVGGFWAGVFVFLLAGLIFAIINALLKPLLIVLSLPFLLLSLGLFTLVINGALIWLTLALVPFVKMEFIWAIVSSLILSLINFIVLSVDDLMERRGEFDA